MKVITDTYTFEIIRKLADGGMGSVYEAQQLGSNGFRKTVALKTILPEFSSEKNFIDQFIGEAILVADLVHENIVQIYQLSCVDDTYYIAMEYIYGINLEQFLQKHKEMGISIPYDILTFTVSRVCRGLEYAHNKTDKEGNPLGVVHRDINPKNIMIASEGFVKVTDFGVAKALNYKGQKEGEVLKGKPQYMSPEQAQFKETDQRSDIFSLGIVMYELLTGESLFKGDSIKASLDNVIASPIPAIEELCKDVPEMVKKILDKCLQRDLEKRYQTAGELGHDLEYYMYHDRYGPTNVTMGKYMKSMFPEFVLSLASENTVIIDGLGKE